MFTAEHLKAWRESGRELLASDIVPSTLDAEHRSTDVIWYTGVDVPRIDWWTGEPYMLKFDPAGVDLSLLNNGAPVLDDHNKYDGCAGQVGVVQRAWVDAVKYKGTLRFSPTPDVDNLWGKVAAGIVTKFSMGVYMPEISELRDGNGNLISKTATKWQPFEISCTPIPADFGTTTLSAVSAGRGLGKTPGAKPATDDVMRRARDRDLEILRLR